MASRRRVRNAVLTGCSVVACLYILSIQDALVGQINLKLERTGFPPLQVLAPRRRMQGRYDILINSYQNSGSRFTADLFGFRKDAFYMYEPLWRMSEQEYVHPPDLICSILNTTCVHGTAADANRARDLDSTQALVAGVRRNETIPSLLTGIMEDVYNCDLHRISGLVSKGVTDRESLAGPSWRYYADCAHKKRIPKGICLELQSTHCKAFRHVVSKVLRATTISFEPILKRKSDLKLIHLFRNPFAIINSRKRSSFAKTVKEFLPMGESLCIKMELDYIGAKELMKKYPDRVKMIWYEDLKSDVSDKVARLYDYVGMEQRPEEARALNVVKLNEAKDNTKELDKLRESDNTRWWRKTIDFRLYSMMFQKCGAVVKLFNMTNFRSEAELRDLSIPEMTLPNEFII